MRLRWPLVAAAAAVLRDVGTSGSLEGKDGRIVLGAAGAAGFAALLAVVVD